MKTRITELLGIEHPILCPGMTHVSNAELVAAVGNAGGLGILAVGHLSPEETRSEIRKVRELSNAPFGVGAALIMPGAKANAEIAIEEKVPVINFSLGKGDWICERVHAYGGKVLATVVNRKHALAAERSIPLRYVVPAFGYMVACVGAALSLALVFFEERELS